MSDKINDAEARASPRSEVDTSQGETAVPPLPPPQAEAPNPNKVNADPPPAEKQPAPEPQEQGQQPLQPQQPQETQQYEQPQPEQHKPPQQQLPVCENFADCSACFNTAKILEANTPPENQVSCHWNPAARSCSSVNGGGVAFQCPPVDAMVGTPTIPDPYIAPVQNESGILATFGHVVIVAAFFGGLYLLRKKVLSMAGVSSASKNGDHLTSLSSSRDHGKGQGITTHASELLAGFGIGHTSGGHGPFSGSSGMSHNYASET